jgi:TRAP-type C4-dicarboxylate transport system substrate-binding protein
MKKFLTAISLTSFLFVCTGGADTTIGTIDGMPVTKTEAEQTLKVLSQGKMTYDKLPPNGKQQLLEVIAPSKIAAKKAAKELTQEEKDAALSNLWIQKQISQTTVSDKEVKDFYDKVKQSSKEPAKIPAFDEVKERIKAQLKQEKAIQNIIKNAKIVVN